MLFGSVMPAGRLAEKPWRTDAVVRLIASVMVCWLMGAVVDESRGPKPESESDGLRNQLDGREASPPNDYIIYLDCNRNWDLTDDPP